MNVVGISERRDQAYSRLHVEPLSDIGRKLEDFLGSLLRMSEFVQ